MRAIFGVLEIEYVDGLFFKGLEARDAVKSHPEFLQKTYRATRELIAGK
ncbi:MAG: hypothetical protein V3V94_02450 [Candidatus Brocadiales bacterium]